MPCFETIRRTRQTIQNKEGFFPPTDIKVMQKRRKKEEVYNVIGKWDKETGQCHLKA
jgi:hypothetical protein